MNIEKFYKSQILSNPNPASSPVLCPSLSHQLSSSTRPLHAITVTDLHARARSVRLSTELKPRQCFRHRRRGITAVERSLIKVNNSLGGYLTTLLY
jgi:hypothetical protein